MKLYIWDTAGLFSGEVEIDDFDPMPPRSTPTAPPDAAEGATFQWQGHAWADVENAEPPAPSVDWPSMIAARRYQAETAGIELQGMQVATDDRSKLLINGAALRASRESGFTLRWKTGDGFIDLSGAQVLAMADAVADHVQRCFDREAELQTAVADGAITAEMLEQGWPA